MVYADAQFCCQHHPFRFIHIVNVLQSGVDHLHECAWMQLDLCLQDWCPELCSNSVAFDPDISSRRTTPNAYTSDLFDTSPVWEYSGAKYLQDSIKGSQQQKMFFQSE
ncbi:unnamed protein product [Rhodiola kirilowii]